MISTKRTVVEGSYQHELAIPISWEFAPLSDVIDIIGGSQPPKSEFRDSPGDGMIRLIQIRDYKSKNHQVFIPLDKAKRFVECDDVMIGRYGPPIFQILRGLSGAYNVALMKAVPRNGCLDKNYLFHFLTNRNIYNYVESASDRTAGQSGVNKAHLEKYPVSFAPLAEQKEIAARLDNLLAQVDSIKTRLDTIPDILKRFRQSVFAAAVSGKLTEEWRRGNTCEKASSLLSQLQLERETVLLSESLAGNKETKRLLTKIKKHKATLPTESLPDGWVWGSFMGSMERVVDCHNKTAPYIQEGIPLIRTPDIRNGKISLNGAKYISQETYDYWSRRCPPETGDIIFTREAPMGEAGIVPKSVKLCMGQRMMLLRPMQKFIVPEYVLFNILSPNFQQRMGKQAIGTGVKHLRVADVESLTYPIAPFQEQLEIVRRVKQFLSFSEQVEQQVKKAQTRVNNLAQSILAKAFRGELTADWRAEHPELVSGENSAQTLLERIKAEQAKLAPQKKGRKKRT